MIKIYPDKIYYIPVMNGERQLYLVSIRGKQDAMRNAEHSECVEWEELQKQGWTIETFWGSEYE